MRTQKQVVVDFVMAIMGKAYDSKQDCGEWFKARPEQKKELSEKVIGAFTSGECELKAEQKNLSTYVSGLISNHLRKAKELNGGVQYKPTNPGSRSGQQDPQIKEARKLAKTFEEGSKQYTQIMSFISGRQAEIKAEKAKVSIDVESLPEELRDLVG